MELMEIIAFFILVLCVVISFGVTFYRLGYKHGKSDKQKCTDDDPELTKRLLEISKNIP